LRSRKVSISLVLFLLIGIIPFGAALSYALLYSFGLVGALSEGFTLTYWDTILASGDFLQSFAYSAIIAGLGVVLSVGIALALVLKMHATFQHKFLSYVIYLPLAIPGVVASFFTLQMLSKSGFFARIAYQIGWITTPLSFPDLVNDSYAIGIIITFVSLVTPFFLLLFLNIYKNEQIERLSDLAYSLGASKNDTIFKVGLPILLKRAKTIIVLYFIFLLGAYEIPLILGQESPQMLSVLIIRELKQFDLTKIPEGYAVAAVYTLVVTLVVVGVFSSKKQLEYES